MANAVLTSKIKLLIADFIISLQWSNYIHLRILLISKKYGDLKVR